MTQRFIASVLLLIATALPAAADCTCRAQGREFELGQSVCLSTPKGARIATCGMVLNNTSWLFTETPCVTSNALPEPPRTRASHAHSHPHGG